MRRLPLLPVLLIALSPLGALGTDRATAGEAPRLLGRVPVKTEGFVRIPHAALEALGAPDATRVTVARRGRPVPTHVGASGGDVVFLAVGHRTNTNAWGVYEIRLRSEPLRAPTPVAPPSGVEPAPDTFPKARRVLGVDNVHGPLPAARPEVYDHASAPTWFLAFVPHRSSASLDLPTLGAAPGTAQTLEVVAYGTHRGRAALRASWGGRDLGVSETDRIAGGATFRWEVPADAVPAEGTTLDLKDVSPPLPPAPPKDVSRGRGSLWIDAVTLWGAVDAVVDDTLRVFDVSSHETLPLDLAPGHGDAGGPHLALLGPGGEVLHDFASLVHEPADDTPATDVVLGTVPPGTRLFASTHAEVATPHRVERVPDPVAAAGAARHVILAVPELLGPAARLAAHRTSEGLPSTVVPVVDVYDAYGHGEPGVDAIRSFLVDLMQRPSASLEYVLLAGDATLDRTDMVPFSTIPAPMARTMYNGATAADRLYVLPPNGSPVGGPALGRLPFRDAATMAAYVDRVIAYETNPPADATRQLMHFVTNEGRFGAGIDVLIERMFRTILAHQIPAAYDVEVTFASTKSPYLWPPPDFNAKVIDAINTGCVFFTYVGHGFGMGFDSLRAGDERFPVLHVDHVGDVACRGTPPVVFVIACTTAIFDQPQWSGVGEALLARPEGPVAYFGATRICHPVANTILGRALARFMAEGQGKWRLGEILNRARDELLVSTERGSKRALITMAMRGLAGNVDVDRLFLEGTQMYTLLGDPALSVAFPRADVGVTVSVQADRRVEARIAADLPDGTEVHVALEVPRDATFHESEPVSDPLDPESFETIRSNHARVNDLAIVRVTLKLEGGVASFEADVPDEVKSQRLVVKAWAVAEGDVHHGAATFLTPPREEEPAPEDDGR